MSAYKDKYINFIDGYNFQNKQNKRYLIIGNSGSGKTSLAISLILAREFGYLKKIVFIIGGFNSILNNLKKDFQKSGIEIEIHVPNTRKEMEQITNSLTNLSSGDLLFIDDYTHLLKTGANFLTKIFTTSRQMGFDIILILHKFKLMNSLIRMNSSKIFITKIERDMYDDFPQLENLHGQEPVVIDDNEFYGMGIENIDFKNINLDKKNLPKLIKNESANTKIDEMIKIGNKNNEMTVKKTDVDLKKKTPLNLKNEVRNGILRALRK